MGKQLKISDLKRVVNVDKFSKYANILKDTKNNDSKQIEVILNELSAKTPSRDVLMKTRLGFILKEVSNRETLSKKVRDKALGLRTKWKDFHKRLLLAPKYDVKCDKPTTENREKARQALTNSFLRTNSSKDQFDSSSEEHLALINDLEFGIFQHCDKLVNGKYFGTIRRCIRILGENPKLRNEYLNFEIKTENLINNYLENNSPFEQFKLSSSSSNSNLSKQPCTSSNNLDFDIDD